MPRIGNLSLHDSTCWRKKYDFFVKLTTSVKPNINSVKNYNQSVSSRLAALIRTYVRNAQVDVISFR